MEIKGYSIMKREAIFSRDLEHKKVIVNRSFDAALDLVWESWTSGPLLDRWWAPKPYQTITKSLDFIEGGKWLYAMVGPQGDASMCRIDYSKIIPQQIIESTAGFCDEEGNLNTDFPVMNWHQRFTESLGITEVIVEIRFEKLADMQMIIEMGFQEGFAMGLSNLDDVLYLR